MAQAPRDENRITTLIGVTSSSPNTSPVTVYVDPTTHRLYVDTSVSGLPTAVTDAEAVDAADTGNLALGTDGANYQILSVDTFGRLILGASTLAIGKLAANSGVDIGDVDVTSIAAGDNNIGNVDIVSGTLTTVSTVTNLSQQGGVAISLNTGVRDTGTQRVTIATNDSVPVTFTGSTDVATQTTLASLLTSSQLIDNAISGAGFNITQFNGAAVPIGAGLEATAVRVTLPTDGTGVVKLGAGTAEIGKLAAGVANIGDVDILTIAAGDNNIGNVDIVSGTITTVSTVTTLTTLTGGGIAHDSADSGNPHKIGFKAYSPDGTTPGTAVAELDRTDAKSDLDGRLLTNDEHPRWWSYHENSSSALTDASVQAAPGAGFQIVITSIVVSTGAATALNFFLEEATTTIWGPDYLEAVAGRGFVSGPINKHITANTAVTITTSAAIAHSVDILGYIQAV